MNAIDELTRAGARSQAYSFLALAFEAPDDSRPGALRQGWDPLAGGLALLADPSCQGTAAELRPAIAALGADALERAYTRCFGHAMSKDCPPYEAEYGQAHVFQKAHTLADVAGFYRAFGLDLAADAHERIDHISVELEFMHFLCAKEAYALAHDHTAEQLALCRAAQRKFLCEHVGRWAFGFARRMGARAGDTVYGVLGKLLAAFLAAELNRLGLRPDEVACPDVVAEGAPATGGEAESTPACEACHGLEGAT